MRKVFLDKFSSYSLFFHISHCSIYLLCLGMICWLDLCIIEFISNMFIMFWFVRFTFHFLFLISFFVGENSVISFSGLFMWSRLLWQAFLSISLDFSGFSEAREVYQEVLLIYVYFVFPFVCYIAIFVISVICWYYLFFCVIFCAHLCFVFCLWFLWFWVRRTRFPFGSIFPWNVIFLFSSFHLMSVSLPTIYNRITSFFQVIREQVKCMKKYFFGKFHSNSPISHRSLCLLCLGIIFWLFVSVIEFI